MITVHRHDLTPSAAVTELYTHGLGVIQPEKARLKEKINGDRCLYLTCPVGGPGAEHVALGRILCYQGQCYRIARLARKESAAGLRLEAEAPHILWDLAAQHIVNIETAEDPIAPDGITAAQALSQVLAGTDFSPGTVTVSGDTLAYLDLLQTDRITAIRQIIEKWGGEIEPDNWSLSLKTAVGQDRGYTLRRGKNIREIDYQEDLAPVVTRLHIIGYQGANIEGINNGKDYIDSAYIGSYPFPREGNATFEDIDDPQELLSLGQQRLAELEKPVCTYRVQLAQLRGSAQYAQYAALEQYDLGDTARVIHEPLGLSFAVRCVEREVDCLTGDNVSVTLGTPGDPVTAALSAGAKAADALTKITRPDGTVRAGKLAGAIDLARNLLQMSGGYANADVRSQKGILLECTDAGSVDYGAMYLGSGVWAMANAKNEDGSWQWKTIARPGGIVGESIDLRANDAITQMVSRATRIEINAENAAALTQNILATQAALGGTLDAVNRGLSTKAEAGDIDGAVADARNALLEVIETLSSRVTQLADSTTLEFSRTVQAQDALKSAQDALQSAQDTLALYLRVSADGVEIGRPGDPLKFEADNATASVNTFEADRFSVRRGGSAEWAWMATQSGLGLKWVGTE